MLAEVHNRAAEAVGSQCCSLRIGDMTLRLKADSADDLILAPDLTKFRSEEINADCDLEITIEWVSRLEKLSGPQLFDSGSLWKLYSESGGLVYDFSTPVLGNDSYKRLIIDHTFSQARLLLNRSCLPDHARVYPLEYPLDELLVTNWLARGRGVEVHGCGLVDRQAGAYLFLGHSGAGKSTTTRLWNEHRDVRVLSDDRIILRQHGNALWMYGTPWHGEAGFAAPAKARVRRIFFLDHGSQNEISSLPTAHAAGELFARSFVPFHGPTLLEFTLSCLHRIAQLIPCYRYKFRPDGSAVGHILNFYG